MIQNNKLTNTVVIPIKTLQNRDISLEARGLLAFILSLAPKWNLSVSLLMDMTGEGYDVIRASVQELEKYGYIVRKRRNKEGKIISTEWEVYTRV